MYLFNNITERIGAGTVCISTGTASSERCIATGTASSERCIATDRASSHRCTATGTASPKCVLLRIHSH